MHFYLLYMSMYVHKYNYTVISTYKVESFLCANVMLRQRKRLKLRSSLLNEFIKALKPSHVCKAYM